jgi:DNA-directed RNA polymerase alpha subunit
VSAFPASTVAIDELPLAVRSAQVCRAAGIATVGELRRVGADALRSLPNVGRKVLHDIEEVIGTWDYAIDDPPLEWTWLGHVPTAALAAELARRFPVTA